MQKLDNTTIAQFFYIEVNKFWEQALFLWIFRSLHLSIDDENVDINFLKSENKSTLNYFYEG